MVREIRRVNVCKSCHLLVRDKGSRKYCPLCAGEFDKALRTGAQVRRYESMGYYWRG